MNKVGFTCSKCGYCCRTLLVENAGILNGLCLIADERQLFNPKFVAPYIALGIDKPIDIVCYQLAKAVCPHINGAGDCAIYEKRPLACQSYPVQITVLGAIAEQDYPQSKFLSIEEKIINEASVKMNRYMMEKLQVYAGQKARMWFFDLITKNWRKAPDPFMVLQERLMTDPE